jgi:hypothetical protein
VQAAVGQFGDAAPRARRDRFEALGSVLVGVIAAQVAGVLGILVEIDERVEQGVQAAGPREVSRLDLAGFGLGGPRRSGEGEQGADAE